MARRPNPDASEAEKEDALDFRRELVWQMARNKEINEARVPFEARVHEILSEAGASPLDPPSKYGGFTLDGIHFDYYPEGGYGYGRRDPSYENPKVHASTMGGNDDFPRSGKTVGWTHAVTPEEVAAAIIEYCQSRDGYDVRGRRSMLTLRKNPRRRRNPVRVTLVHLTPSVAVSAMKDYVAAGGKYSWAHSMTRPGFVNTHGAIYAKLINTYANEGGAAYDDARVMVYPTDSEFQALQEAMGYDKVRAMGLRAHAVALSSEITELDNMVRTIAAALKKV